MAVLAVVVALSTILTLLNLLILLGVIRRLRTMATSGQENQPELLPTLGTRVGAFTAVSTAGVAVTEADLASGSSTVLLLSPGCMPCQGTAAKLAKDRATLPQRLVVLLRAQPVGPDLDAMLETLAGVGTVATYEGDAGVEEAFGSKGFPTAMRIEDGIVVDASYKYAEVLPDRVPA